MNMYVMDVSKHQNSLHAARAKQAGAQALILRHAYATTKDTLALSWAPAVQAAGMPLGGYGFATWHYKSRCGGSIDTARALMHQQVQTWIDAAKATGTGWWFAVDQELERNCEMGLGKADNTVLLNEACDLLAAAGLHPCVYCSVSWDMSYISTAVLRYPYWMARYYDGKADFGDPGSDLMQLPAGKYTDWMRKLYEAGRLVGWQFASTGRGAQYGVGSESVDRNIFYAEPVVAPAPMCPVEAQSDAQYIQIGPLSAGDMRAVQAKCSELAIPSTAVDGLLRTDVAASTGDQVQLIRLATTLQVPIQMQDTPFVDAQPAPAPEIQPTPQPAPQPEPAPTPEQYSVIWMAAVVKGGFASAADAKDYIESILGKDAMEELQITVAKE